MKKTIVIRDKDGAKEQEINYIPFRFILAIEMDDESIKDTILQRLIRVCVRVLSPLL